METVSLVLLHGVAKERLGLTSLGLVIIQMALGHQNRRKDPIGLLLLHGSQTMTLLLFFFILLQPQRIECDGMSPASIARKLFWDQ